jgi:probable addiction module antidote protein
MTAINPKAARRLGVRRFDAAEYLKDEADIAAYVAAALAENDPRVLAATLGAVARARGMTQLAKATGISREALYRALSADGNPGLETLFKVLGGLGLRLDVRPAASTVAAVSTEIKAAQTISYGRAPSVKRRTLATFSHDRKLGAKRTLSRTA